MAAGGAAGEEAVIYTGTWKITGRCFFFFFHCLMIATMRGCQGREVAGIEINARLSRPNVLLTMPPAWLFKIKLDSLDSGCFSRVGGTFWGLIFCGFQTVNKPKHVSGNRSSARQGLGNRQWTSRGLPGSEIQAESVPET